ncbi:MAG: hypothetical protein LH480_06950 [Rubrivivax sp.]|nr:hypothetical protein [Rubrivivax sp.]
MPISPIARPRQRVCGSVSVVRVVMALAGCGAATSVIAGPSGGTLAQATLATQTMQATLALLAGAALVLAALCFMLGRLLERLKLQIALRTTREALRSTDALLTNWRWQTDAYHHLLQWKAPGSLPTTHCALFDSQAGPSGPMQQPLPMLQPHSLLHQRLHAGQPFSGLRLRLQLPLEGHHGWALRGVPRLDAFGAFAGFSGTAHPTDDDDALQAGAAAWRTLLQCQSQPVLMLMAAARAESSADSGTDASAEAVADSGSESGAESSRRSRAKSDAKAGADAGHAAPAAHPAHAGWQVQQFNAAALALWPQLVAGAALAAAQPVLTPALQARLDAALPPGAGDRDTTNANTADEDGCGWRLHTVNTPGTTPHGPRCVLLMHTAADTMTPHTAAAAADAAKAEQAEQAERANERAREQALESDNFSFTLSHDLRAPIRVVEGFTRIVKEDYGRHLDRVGNDHLDRVLGAAARMNLMIDALLTLARLSQQPLARQRVNLTQLAGYVVDELQRSAPERVVEFDIQPGLTARGDPTLLRLVLENLLGNAWKYSARSAVAQISLRQQQQQERTVFVVRDNGAGFDMRSAERLFGLFQRLHSASDFPGHGVGLASVKRIVQRHGGDAWAEAEPGRGAAFSFTLPE